MKAFVVMNQDNIGAIVFHESAGKAKYLALKEYETFECEVITDLSAKRCKAADYLAITVPSILNFCFNAEIYKKLGWYCESTTYCDNEKCVMRCIDGDL